MVVAGVSGREGEQGTAATPFLAREGQVALRGARAAASPLLGWAHGLGGSHVALWSPPQCWVQASTPGGGVFLEDDPVRRDSHISLVANYIS